MEASWVWFSIAVFFAWGILGIVQKLATNLISAESAFLWAIAGFMVLQPIMYNGTSPFSFSTPALTWAFTNGILNGVGVWALMAALGAGGKASVVLPITALYPLFFALLAPIVLHERVTALQRLGVLCGTASIILLSMDSPGH